MFVNKITQIHVFSVNNITKKVFYVVFYYLL